MQFIELGFLVTLLVIGFFAGTMVERAHYASIRKRERELADVLAFMVRFPFDRTTPQRAFLVHGTVVISADYFKTFVAGLRNLFGGRARREAILRLKEQARQRGAKMIICVRFETTTISRGWAAAMEVLAYGTALIPEDGSTEHEPIPAPRSRLLVEGSAQTAAL
jgi:uncharacterized protein YbjQ (UPF0145 family)